jgi:hypothetical protein
MPAPFLAALSAASFSGICEWPGTQQIRTEPPRVYGEGDDWLVGWLYFTAMVHRLSTCPTNPLKGQRPPGGKSWASVTSF